MFALGLNISITGFYLKDFRDRFLRHSQVWEMLNFQDPGRFQYEQGPKSGRKGVRIALRAPQNSQKALRLQMEMT